MTRHHFSSYVNGKFLVITIVLLSIFSYIFYVNHTKEQNFQQAIMLLENHNHKDRAQSIYLLTRLSEQDHPAAQYRLAELLLDSDKEKALNLLTQLAGNGNLHGLELLGLIHIEDNKIKQGYAYIHQAASQDHPNSQLYLAMCFYSGDCGLPTDETLAFYWAQRAVINGETAAQLIVNKLTDKVSNDINEPAKHHDLINSL
ncbi:tetratricopeptide repeat protein [Photobacterium nomapromontoriensis]|uniref:tetratricopeptide repeat protein n=1 Tax=Photobacterium nomapromontoriensis TaxID=2910237 RepID=UPI003D0C0F2F